MKITIPSWAKIILLLICLNKLYAVEIGFKLTKSQKSKAHNNVNLGVSGTTIDSSLLNDYLNLNTTNNKDIPDLPFYFEGWVKYLHFNEGDKTSAKSFWKNTAYEEQTKKGVSGQQLAEKDNIGYLNIPNELYFFAVLFKDTLSIMSSRKDAFTNLLDTLDIANIQSIPEDNHFAGGVKDIGKFDEGFCFKVQSRISTEQFQMSAATPDPEKFKPIRWVFCSDTEVDKTKLMNLIIQLRLKKQHQNGIYLETDYETKKNQMLKNKSELDKKSGDFGAKNGKDGYWILLSDWTQCTLACGGGLQYQQLMCVPPKAGGKPCQGPAIRTRPCNTQPCPEPVQLGKIVKPMDSLTGSSANNTLPLITKVMPVSSRPQRYDKCFLKEADALMELDNASTKEFITKPKVPVRLVLNDRTITAYQNDDLKSMYISFNLNEAIIIRVTEEKNCFKVKTNLKSTLFCQLDAGNSAEFVEEWDYDFNLFKNQCKKPRVKSQNVIPEEKKLEAEFKNKVQSMKLDLVTEKAEVLKKKTEEDEEVKLNRKVEQAESTSMMAIQKESKLEELLEKEELAKEDDETKTLEEQITAEKKKEECLLKSIKEKELENQYNLAKAHAEENIKKIQEQTKLQVAKKRLEIKKKIQEMRKKQERKKAQLRNEIMLIRTQIANKITTVSKEGDESRCRVGSLEEEREQYCSNNFADNYAKYSDCKDETNFCYVCCEFEFGEFHILKRDKCYANCDATKKATG